MEEDNPTPKRSIFQFLLGREQWPELYKEFLKLKMEFFQAMGYRAWVSPELCEEVSGEAGGVGIAEGPRLQVLTPAFLSDPGPEPTSLGLESGAPVRPVASQGTSRS